MSKYADIKGTTATSFKIGASATAGHVLTADVAGVGSWQAPTGEGGGSMPGVEIDCGTFASDIANMDCGSFV